MYHDGEQWGRYTWALSHDGMLSKTNSSFRMELLCYQQQKLFWTVVMHFSYCGNTKWCIVRSGPLVLRASWPAARSAPSGKSTKLPPRWRPSSLPPLPLPPRQNLQRRVSKDCYSQHFWKDFLWSVCFSIPKLLHDVDVFGDDNCGNTQEDRRIPRGTSSSYLRYFSLIDLSHKFFNS